MIVRAATTPALGCFRCWPPRRLHAGRRPKAGRLPDQQGALLKLAPVPRCLGSRRPTGLERGCRTLPLEATWPSPPLITAAARPPAGTPCAPSRAAAQPPTFTCQDLAHKGQAQGAGDGRSTRHSGCHACPCWSALAACRRCTGPNALYLCDLDMVSSYARAFRNSRLSREPGVVRIKVKPPERGPYTLGPGSG